MLEILAAGEPGSGLGPLDYAAVAGYLLVTMGIVAWASRKQADTEDFFLGGRSMPWMAVGLSMMATLLSTNTYLGVPGETIRYGVAYTVGYVAFPLVVLVVWKLWIPFFMRLHMTSAYEYLESRFDYRARLTGGVLFLLLRLGWMSMVVYTASLAMVEMVREPLHAASAWIGVEQPIYLLIGVVGFAATVYTCVGGMRAVIWTDVLQAVMLFGGVALIIGYVMIVEGVGPATWWQKLSTEGARHTRPIWFSFDITERVTIFTAILSIFFWNVCTHLSDQVVLQRYFTTRSLQAARNTLIVNVVSNIAISLLLMLSGLALLYFYVEHPTYLPDGLTPMSGADKVMPYFYAHQLPAGLGGLILASFLCDAMQTLVSGVNSISAIATSDVLERSAEPKQRRWSDLALARGITIGVGLVATGLAYAVTYFAQHSSLTIIDLMPRTFNMFLSPLATLFLIGLFLPRATGRTALVAVTGAMLFSFTWSWWAELPGLFAQLGLEGLADAWQNLLGVDAAGKNKRPTIMLAVGAPWLFGFLLGGVSCLVLERGGEHRGRNFTWRAVMRRPLPVD